MNRNNETWVSHLKGVGADQRSALTDLRSKLIRGLRRGLSAHPVDDAFLEDAAQDALLQILDRLAQFEGRSEFVTWATSIAIRVALTELRRRRWKDVSLDTLVADADVNARRATDHDGSAQIERQAILDTMHAVLNETLTEKQRTALLAELQGMPQEEIARHLGSNRNAVYKLTHDARKRLKRGLEAAGYRTEDVRGAFAT